MCQFLSALVFARGSVLCQPEVTDHHSELLERLKISDHQRAPDRRLWRKVEFLPPELPVRNPFTRFNFRDWSQLADADKYELVYDDADTFYGTRTRPDWYYHYEDFFANRCRQTIADMTIRGRVARLDGGAHIIAAGGRVDEVTGKTRIVSCAGQIGHLGSQATVDRAEEGARLGVVEGRVQGLLPGARIDRLLGQVDIAWSDARIQRLRGMIGLAIDGLPNISCTSLAHSEIPQTTLPDGVPPRGISPGDFSYLIQNHYTDVGHNLRNATFNPSPIIHGTPLSYAAWNRMFGGSPRTGLSVTFTPVPGKP